MRHRLLWIALPALFVLAQPAAWHLKRGPSPSEPQASSRYYLDDHPLKVGYLVEEPNRVWVGVRDFVEQATQGYATATERDKACVVLDKEGAARLTIPMDAKGGQIVVRFQRDGKWLTRSSKLAEGDNRPTNRIAADGSHLLAMDLASLCGLLGITVCQDEDAVRLYTPDYWAGPRLGLLSETATPGKRLLDNFALMPELGSAPPARKMYFWFRLPEKAYVQIYDLSNMELQPVLGSLYGTFDQDDQKLRPKRDGYLNTPWRVDGGDLKRVWGELTEIGPDDRYIEYAAVVSTVEPPSPTPEGFDYVKFLRSKKVDDARVCVVGLKQPLVNAPISYKLVYPAKSMKISEAAAIYTMDQGIFESMNGLHSGELVQPGKPVVVFGKIDEKELNRVIASDTGAKAHAAKPGETMEDLAKQYGTSPDDLRKMNPQLPASGKLAPGEMVTIPAGAKPANSSTDWDPLSASGFAKRSTKVFERITGEKVVETLQKGDKVVIVSATGDRSWFRISDPLGYVRGDDLSVSGGRPGPAFVGASSKAQQLIRVAMSYKGVPTYHMGGTRIDKAIDCSNFVSQVFTKAGIIPAPPPPVHSMEGTGELVMVKKGLTVIEKGGKVLAPPPNVPRSIDALRPGDRLIFQESMDANYSDRGSHHVGIYIGNYNVEKPHAYIHCSSSRHGVDVDDLTKWLWGRFQYAVRDRALGTK